MPHKAVATAPEKKAPAVGDRKSRLAAAMGEAGSDKRKTRRKIVSKMYSLLIKTPAGDDGAVEGTPFSRSGVERLMSVLQKRADEPGVQGAKAAAGMLKFLSVDDDSDENINGASVEKLRWIAKMGKRFKK